jgi:hypothetical protein
MLTGNSTKAMSHSDYHFYILDGQEIFSRKMDPEDEKQAKFVAVDSRLLKTTSTLYKELCRPHGYTPLLADNFMAFFNPNDPNSFTRKYMNKPVC